MASVTDPARPASADSPHYELAFPPSRPRAVFREYSPGKPRRTFTVTVEIEEGLQHHRLAQTCEFLGHDREAVDTLVQQAQAWTHEQLDDQSDPTRPT